MFWPISLQFWGPLPGCCAPFPSAASGPGSQRLGALSTGAPRLFPPRRAARAARGLAPSPWARGTFSLRGPSSRHLLGLRKSLDRNRGPVCSVGGGGFSGAEFAPFPSPRLLPPAGMGRLLWSFSVPLFCEPPAVCSGRSIFPALSHSLKKSPSDCSQGLLAGPHPKQCRGSSPIRPLLSIPPPLAGGGCGCLGVLFCWDLLLGT